MQNKTRQEKLEKQMVWRMLFSYLKGYMGYVIISLLLAAVTVALSLSLPFYTGKAIDCILEPGKVDFPTLYEILKTMGILVVVGGVGQWIMGWCNNRLAFSVTRDIRKDAMDKLQRLPLSYIDSHDTGDLLSRMISDVEQFSDGLLLGFTQLFTGVITIVGTLLFMLDIDVTITIVVVVVTPLSFFMAGFIAKRTYHMFRAQSEIRGEQTAYIDEMVQNQKVVQAYGREAEVEARFDEMNKRLGEASLRAVFYSSLTNPCTRFVNSMVYGAVAVFGAIAAVKGGLSVGNLTCFLSYASQYTKPFNEISGVVTELQNAIACAGRVFGLILEEPEVSDENNAVLSEVSGHVSLDDVSFSYIKEKPLIQNLTLDVEAGKRVAIVGPTGCGKTTVINLLMRFYDVNSGSISVDDIDIRKITRESLRENYGMVLQETWLKSGTIKENIAMGKPDATMEEIIAAAKATHAHSFIKRLPEGYDTKIGESGGELSAGQKQLLCITRVMLCLPPMLILDEATSSIDTRTELRIQNAFAKMMKGRTSFIVAHRLSTIQSADVILVMKDGHIEEMGNHESLLAKKGFYANLYESQFVGLQQS